MCLLCNSCTRNLGVAALLLIFEGRRLITANMLLVWCAQEDVEAGTLKLILRLDLHSEVCARRPTYTAAFTLCHTSLAHIAMAVSSFASLLRSRFLYQV